MGFRLSGIKLQFEWGSVGTGPDSGTELCRNKGYVSRGHFQVLATGLSGYVMGLMGQATLARGPLELLYVLLHP